MNIPVIILNWNGWEDTLKCLQSLNELSEVEDVWLVDNASTLDRTAECIRLMPRVRVVKMNSNFGWAGGYNRALKMASDEGFEFAYLLNNDTTVSQGFLESTQRAILQDNKTAACGSIIIYADKEWVKFDGSCHGPNEHRFVPARDGELRLTSEVNGAGMLVRLKAMQQHGWFDERYFCYGEEVEWCRRMLHLGWLIKIAPRSVIYHRTEGSSINGSARYYRSRNRFLLLQREGEKATIGDRLRLILDLMRTACGCWVLADTIGYHAILSAVQDGLLGRFGRRNEQHPTFICLVVGAVAVRAVWVCRKLNAWSRQRFIPQKNAVVCQKKRVPDKVL